MHDFQAVRLMDRGLRPLRSRHDRVVQLHGYPVELHAQVRQHAFQCGWLFEFQRPWLTVDAQLQHVQVVYLPSGGRPEITECFVRQDRAARKS
jgi:hypothetical protein